MNYLGTRSKIALTVNGEAVTGYEFDYQKESKNSIALWNDNTIVWYDKKTCELTKKITGVSNIVLKHNLFILTYDKYKGANDLDGKTIILSEKYIDIRPNKYCIEVVDEKKQNGVYSYAGTYIMPVGDRDYSFLESGMIVEDRKTHKSYGLYPYNEGGCIIHSKYTYAHSKNDEIIIYESDEPDEFVIFSHKGEIKGTFKSKGNRFYLLDKAIKIERRNSEGLDKKGLISFDGREIVPPEYDYITEFGKEKKIYILDIGKKAGMATLDKGIVVSVEFDEDLFLYDDEYILFKKGDENTLYTYEGKLLIPLTKETICPISSDTPGAFRIIDSSNCVTTYIAPLNKYLDGNYVIKYDKENENYYYLDKVLDDWVKI